MEQSVQWLSLCDPMDCSTPGLPVHHHLPEFAQTHVHWVDDAIQPSHSLSSPSPPDLSLSQHHGLFQWVGSLLSDSQSIGASASASVLPMNIEGWFPLGLTGMISLQSKGLSRVFSNTIVQKYQFFGAWLSLWHSAFRWVYLSSSPLPFASLLFSLYPPNRGRAGQKTRLQIKDAQLILFIPTEPHI